MSKLLKLIKRIKNILFDQVCIVCSSKNLSDNFSFLCKDCYDAFLYSDKSYNNEISRQDKICNICKHPLNNDNKCPSCSLIKPIYYDNYFFYYHYNDFFKIIVNVWKKQEYFVFLNIFEKIITTDTRIDKKIPLTIVPDNFLQKMRKGRVAFYTLIKRLKKRGFNIIIPPFKRRISGFKHQKNKNKAERITNISKLYYLPKKNIDRYSGEIYLLDDIYTTGSTLNFAAKLLKEAGFQKVTVISIFRAVISVT